MNCLHNIIITGRQAVSFPEVVIFFMQIKEDNIMIRTDAVRLTTIKAFAYRQKQADGDIGIVIVKPDGKQPGIAGISKKTGEPIPTANTNQKIYPIEAFKEAMELTKGLRFEKQGPLKVNKGMLREPKAAPVEEEVKLNEDACQKIAAKYIDKNGAFSYDLINKELISFAKRSSIVRGMIEDGKSAKAISTYIVNNKFRNLAGNQNLTDQEIAKIVEVLDGTSKRGIFKELNAEIRKLLAANKK